MQPQCASRTALGTALMRAFHQQVDGPSLLLEDSVALPLLGETLQTMLSQHVENHQSSAGRALRSHVCLRSRFAEDRLRLAVERGVRRYVLVGAGLDTFAWRQPVWAQALQIVEVDHPATQAAKREMLQRAGLPQPTNLIFATADLSRQTLGEVLAEHNVGCEQPAYFSWLGVAMYLEPVAIEATLRAMAAFAPGSEVTMTFKPPFANEDETKLAKYVASLGEHFVSFFTSEAMEKELRRCGFREVTFLTPERAHEQYFAAGCALPPPERTNIVSAAN